MKILVIASNFPNQFYPTIAPWSKLQVDSIKQNTKIDIEVLAPRPFVIPLKYFPFNEFSHLPDKEVSDTGYTIYHPYYPYLVPKKILFSLTGNTFSFFISRYIEKYLTRPDLIHARFGFLDGYGALEICQKWKIPLIFDVHGSRDFGEYLVSCMLKKKQQKTIHYARKILCVAEWQIKRGLEIGIPEEKLICIPLGVDIEKFNPQQYKSIKKELGVDTEIVILFVGQLIKRKSIDTLLQALSKIDRSSQGKYKVFIIGGGPEKDNLKALSKKLNLCGYIEFLGKIPDEELTKWYSVADMFILPSLSEGRPTVINEAMASECAIIASNVSGIPEQVKNNHNGFLIEPQNVAELKDRIQFLLDNPSELEKMKKNSRRRVIEEGWTWENYARKVTKIYCSLID